jgi:nucleotide-binding universal stress UspA family protein
MAGRLGDTLVLATVVETPLMSLGYLAGGRVAVPPVQAMEAELEAHELSARELLDRTVLEEGLSGAESQVVSGLAAEQLVGIAENRKAELIVVGYRGRGMFKSTLLGSVSRDVLSLARCPVVVVPADDTA